MILSAQKLRFQGFNMGNELPYVCLVATRRLMMLIGVVFGLIWFVQYFELPYVNVPSSSGPSWSRDSLSNPPASRDSMELGVSKGVASIVKASDGMDGDRRNIVNEFIVRSGGNSSDNLGDDFDLEKGNSLNDTFGDEFRLENGKTLNDTLDDGIDPEVEMPLNESLEMDRDSAIEKAVRNELGKSKEALENSASPNHDEIGETPSSLLSHMLPPQNPEPSPVSNIQLSTSMDNFSSRRSHKSRKFRGQPAAGVPISEMNDLMRKSRVSYHYKKPRWPSQADEELRNAKKLIESADSIIKNPRLDVNVYRNFSAFTRSYELMEQTLKIYIYTEGERPVFHQPELGKIYASEGWFMKQLEENKHFLTKNGNKAHLFYLPFSSLILRKTLYVPDSHSRKDMVRYLSSYLQNITTTYNFWNRTSGTDHFLVACHDWAPAVTGEIMNNCIRAICNADVRKRFQFDRDVSLPVTYIRDATNTLRNLGGKPSSQRHILAFFAGSMHGYLRPILLKHWANKDPDMKIFGTLRKAKGQMTYSQYMKRSKYCISAKGYEPHTPRVVEAIFYECVPVILSDNYIPPFFETLNWESFAVFVLEKDIPNLKNILAAIPDKRYNEMQKRVRQVQKHFLWHVKPLKYDVFHMILHSLWYTRVLQAGA